MPTRHSDHSTPLTEFASYFKIDPFYFWGFCDCEDTSTVITTEGCRCQCGDRWFEYQQITKKVSREAVSLALSEAEQDLLHYLGYAVMPTYFENEAYQYATMPSAFYGNYWQRRDGAWKTLDLYGYVQNLGFRTYSNPIAGAVTPNLPIVYREQAFTITAAVPVGTNPDDLQVFVALADRFNEADFERWQINPIQSVTIDGLGNATIQIAAYLLGQPVLTHSPQTCLDRDDVDSYLTTVEVRIVSYDACDQGLATGRVAGCHGEGCESEEITVCGMIKDAERGIVAFRPAACNEAGVLQTQACAALIPDKIAVHYVAGYPLLKNRIHPIMRAAVMNLAAARLACEIPTCQCSECTYKEIGILHRVYKEKIVEGPEGLTGDSYTLLFDKNHSQDYPFGIKWGEMIAYQKIKKQRQLT